MHKFQLFSLSLCYLLSTYLLTIPDVYLTMQCTLQVQYFLGITLIVWCIHASCSSSTRTSIKNIKGSRDVLSVLGKVLILKSGRKCQTVKSVLNYLMNQYRYQSKIKRRNKLEKYNIHLISIFFVLYLPTISRIHVYCFLYLA